MTEAAYKMFPTDAPATPAPVASLQVTATPAPAAQQPSPEPDASKMFPTEKPQPATAAVAGVFDHWALSAQIDGRADEAEAIRETSASLSRSLQEMGTSQDDVGELMDAVKDAQGNTVFGPVTDERLSLDRARAEEWIEENQIPASDLGLARRLVDDLDRSTPGLKAWLVNSGQGNDPKTIALAVREAKRRYGHAG